TDARALGIELALEAPAVDRRQRVHPDVRVRHAVDEAGERPPIATQPGVAGHEVEVVAPRPRALPARRSERDVGHDGAADGPARPADERAPDGAAAAVGADDDRRPPDAPGRLDAHAAAVAGDVHHALVLAEL